MQRFRFAVALGALWLAVLPLHAQAPANATARCKDGTYSTAVNAQGRCSHHGGVAEVLATRAATQNADGEKTAKATPPLLSVPAGATAKCRDGTYSQAKNHRGACSHHGGVAVWYK